LKKLFIPLSILLLTITFSVNAVTNEQMGAVLERFTARQYDLLFKSDLVNFSSEYSNVFRLEEQAGMYESLRSEAEAQRESVQNERDAIVKTI
jgi:hypothetical protein